jgi:membrane-bound lytic murein transglycosylase A
VLWGIALSLAVLLVLGLREDLGPPQLTLSSSDFAALAGWQQDRVAAAVPAFLRSCARFLAWPDVASFDAAGPPTKFGRVGDWRPLCREAQRLPPGDDALARRFFAAGFVPMAAADDGEDAGLFTGYFEVELDGSRTRYGRFQTPIYRRPFDPALVTRYSRAAIEAGALSRHGLALAWVADPIGAFFMQIQGSGRVRLRDGTVIRLGYDGQNGRPYVPVGRLLVERGKIPRDKLSMAAIRSWMTEHPAAGAALRREDPSFVFFRERPGDGPVGAEQVVLTPRRSIAVDPSFIPFGVPIWLDAEERYLPGQRLRRLLVAQDSGGAIKGPVRGDFFWGSGADAGKRAGEMNATGRYFLLLPRSVAARYRSGEFAS